MDAWRIIGIDCAVNPADVGVAVGSLQGDRLHVEDAVQCVKKSVADAVCDFVRNDTRTLFAFDAPLGWPASLGSALVEHSAGEFIPAAPHTLFRRRTDAVVKAETGQQPLDVGADRIARTAVAALTLLRDIRARLDAEVPLAWSVPPTHARCAIEVYPAATLAQRGLVPRAYKDPKHRVHRMELFDELACEVDLHTIRDIASARADAFDAALCVVAGADFLQDCSRAPRREELPSAKREGWIWVRKTQ